MKSASILVPLMFVLLTACDSDFDPATADQAPPAEPAAVTIPTVAANVGNFETLLAALEAAGLTGRLADPDASTRSLPKRLTRTALS